MIHSQFYRGAIRPHFCRHKLTSTIQSLDSHVLLEQLHLDQFSNLVTLVVPLAVAVGICCFISLV